MKKLFVAAAVATALLSAQVAAASEVEGASPTAISARGARKHHHVAKKAKKHHPRKAAPKAAPTPPRAG